MKSAYPVSWGKRVTVWTFLAALYFLSAKFGLLLAFVNTNATPVWPCTALALTAGLLLGLWTWPAIFAGAFLANVTTPVSVPVALGIAVGNTLEGLVGAWMVRRFAGGIKAFNSPQLIITYTGITALFSTTLSATIGVTSLCLGGARWSDYSTIWLTWWVGDTISDLVLAPFIILWFTKPRLRWSSLQVYEAILIISLLYYLGQCVFAGWLPVENKHYPFDFICVPLLLWPAFRLGQREAASAALVLSCIALAGTLQGYGPFSMPSPNHSLLLLQSFMGVSSVMTLVIAAVVSEGKVAEEALRESEAGVRAILNTTVDAIITIDDRGDVLSFNPAAEHMFGYASGEVIGRNVKILITSPHHESREADLDNFIRTGAAKIIGAGREVRGRRKDGSLFDMDLSVSQVNRGQRTNYTAIIRDITERRHAERERGRLAAIVDSSSDAIVGTDLDGTIRTWNEGAERMFGYRADEVMGRTNEFMTPPEQIREVAEVLGKIQAGERVGNLETVRRTKDGRVINLSLMISPVRDTSGRMVGLSAIARDVTAQKKGEQQLLQTTADLARSNKDLEHFAYIASHDLQEPLRKIRGFTELLAHRYAGKLDPDADTFIAFTVDGVKRLQQLIDDLLAYSRVGRGEVPMTDVKIGDIVKDVLGLLERQIQESGAQVDVGELPTVHGNDTLLRQLMQNLISNATKFRGKDPLRIAISAERHDGHWRFAVADNGIGIDPESHERIFLIFQRLHTRKEYAGTGIGLSVCKRIIERHGGAIWVDSAPNTGSTFYFTIPDRDAAPFAVV